MRVRTVLRHPVWQLFFGALFLIVVWFAFPILAHADDPPDTPPPAPVIPVSQWSRSGGWVSPPPPTPVRPTLSNEPVQPVVQQPSAGNTYAQVEIAQLAHRMATTQAHYETRFVQMAHRVGADQAHYEARMGEWAAQAAFYETTQQVRLSILAHQASVRAYTFPPTQATQPLAHPLSLPGAPGYQGYRWTEQLLDWAAPEPLTPEWQIKTLIGEIAGSPFNVVLTWGGPLVSQLVRISEGGPVWTLDDMQGYAKAILSTIGGPEGMLLAELTDIASRELTLREMNLRLQQAVDDEYARRRQLALAHHLPPPTRVEIFGESHLRQIGYPIDLQTVIRPVTPIEAYGLPNMDYLIYPDTMRTVQLANGWTQHQYTQLTLANNPALQQTWTPPYVYTYRTPDIYRPTPPTYQPPTYQPPIYQPPMIYTPPPIFRPPPFPRWP